MKVDKEHRNHVISEINNIKSDLIRKCQELESKQGNARIANQLSRIIGRLEHWQHMSRT